MMSLQQKDIHKFALANDLDSLREYIRQEKDVNVLNFDRDTALHIAVKEGNFDVVSILVNAGTKINFKNKAGATPLNLAAFLNRNKIADLLIQKGASNDIFTGVCRNDITLVRELLEGGENPNSKYIDSVFEGNTPLHQAVMSSNTEMVILLLENGANPHLKNNFLGVTPLTLAQTKNVQMFEVMLRYTEDVA